MPLSTTLMPASASMASNNAGNFPSQRRQQRPITWAELRPLSAQLALQHRDLVAQDEDLGVLVSIGHRHESQERERVRHTEVRQS
jgi:hypothetical protein